MTTATAVQTLQEIPLDQLEPSPYQTRRFTAGAQDLEELAESIRQLGVLEPVLVRPGTGEVPYQLLAGERRLRAARLAGLDAIPAIVRELDDDAALEVTVTENLHREDLHPLDEAAAIELLLARYGDVDEVAARIGRPRSFIARRSRLCTLTEAWREAIEYRPPAPVKNNGEPCRECGATAEDLSYIADPWAEPDLCVDCALDTGALDNEDDDAPRPDLSSWGVTHLEVIARLAPADQDAFLGEVGNAWHVSTWTAADLERKTESWLHQLSAAPWRCSDPKLVPEVGACTECPQRASVIPGLFDDVEPGGKGIIPAGDRCLMPSCWNRKLGAHIAAQLQELEADTGDAPLKLTTEYSRRNDYATVYHYHGVRTSPEPKRGYTPAVQIDGPEAGHVVYVKEETSSGATSSSGKKPAADKTAAEKLAAGEERLERRRLKLANEKIVAAIEAGARAPKTQDVWALVVCAGCNGRHAYSAGEFPVAHANPKHINAAREKAIGKARGTWDAFEAMGPAGVSAGAALVWHESVWPHIKSRCEYSPHRSTNVQHRELCAVAELVKVDHQALTAEATEELPEPKSWAKLREQVAAEKEAKRKPKKKRGKGGGGR